MAPKGNHVIWGSIDGNVNVNRLPGTLATEVQFIATSSSASRSDNSSEYSSTFQERRRVGKREGISEHAMMEAITDSTGLEPTPVRRSDMQESDARMPGNLLERARAIYDAAVQEQGHGQPDPVTDEAKVAWINRMLRDGLEPSTGMWSAGTECHVHDTCKACHFVHSTGGCERGPNCVFCHIPHTNPDNTKVAQSRRAYCKRFATVIYERYKSEPETFYQLCLVVSTRSDFLRGVLQEKLDGLFGPGRRSIPRQVLTTADGEGGGPLAPSTDPTASGSTASGSRSSASPATALPPPRREQKIILSL